MCHTITHGFGCGHEEEHLDGKLHLCPPGTRCRGPESIYIPSSDDCGKCVQEQEKKAQEAEKIAQERKKSSEEWYLRYLKYLTTQGTKKAGA